MNVLQTLYGFIAIEIFDVKNHHTDSIYDLKKPKHGKFQ
jgi:hypothetical protein